MFRFTSLLSQRVVLIACTAVGAILAALLLPRAGDSASLTDAPARAHAVSLARFVYASFGALSGWTIGSVALYFAAALRKRDS